MKNKILHSAAVEEFAETHISRENWGSDPEKGLLPFQVAYLENIDGEVWTPIPEGLPLSKIIGSSDEAKQSQLKRQCLYFPNTVETSLFRGRLAFRKIRRVAVYRYLVIDIDCKTETDRWGAYDLIHEFPIPFTMLVSSGNGFHVYWELKPIHTVIMDEASRCLLEERYDRLIKSFCAKLGGDNTKASYLGHAMRVPGTWNLKNPFQPLQCKILEKNGRVYSFSDLERLAKDKEVYVMQKPGRKRRPPRPQRQFVAKVLRDHFRITGQSRLPKHFRRYLELILQFRKCPYFVEGATNRSVLGSDGRRIAEARRYFLNNGYIVVAERGNRFRKQATRYQVTGKFFDDFGFPKPKGAGGTRLAEVSQRISETDVKANERRSFQAQAYLQLRNAGADHEQSSKVIIATLAKRSCGLRHTDSEVQRDLLYLKDHFVGLGKKNWGEASLAEKCDTDLVSLETASPL
jgi:hypothetical protein